MDAVAGEGHEGGVLTGELLADFLGAIATGIDHENHLEGPSDPGHGARVLLDDLSDMAGLVANGQDDRDQVFGHAQVRASCCTAVAASASRSSPYTRYWYASRPECPLGEPETPQPTVPQWMPTAALTP